MTATTPALVVRDAMYDRVKAMPFFTEFTFAKNKAMRVQIQDIPYCGVYLVNELRLPEGDSNAGNIRFRDSCRIGFSVVIVDNANEAGEETLDEAYNTICEGLFTDTTFTGFNNKLIQGLTRGERMHVFGSVALDNETPLMELQFDLTVDLGTAIYNPVITDTLDTMHITVRPLGHDENTPPVQLVFDFTTIPLKGADNGRQAADQAARPAQDSSQGKRKGRRATSPIGRRVAQGR
jgi:hypothetical protein